MNFKKMLLLCSLSYAEKIQNMVSQIIAFKIPILIPGCSPGFLIPSYSWRASITPISFPGKIVHTRVPPYTLTIYTWARISPHPTQCCSLRIDVGFGVVDLSWRCTHSAQFWYLGHILQAARPRLGCMRYRWSVRNVSSAFCNWCGCRTSHSWRYTTRVHF